MKSFRRNIKYLSACRLSVSETLKENFLWISTCGGNRVFSFNKQMNPAGPFAVMAERLDGSDINTLKEVPGSDHKYSDAEQLGAIISEWVSGLES